MRILVIANTGWYLYKFRYNLIQALIQHGNTICIACPEDEYSQRLVSELGIQWQSIPSNPRRIVPHMEVFFVYRLFITCKRFKPNICMTYTPRVNCYISFVPLRMFKIKLVRNISGLGDSLLPGRKLQKGLAKYLYKRAYDSYWTFYQNGPDMRLGLAERFSKTEKSSLLPGSGVDLDRFEYYKREDQPTRRLLLAARLIPAKGYLDFIELATRYSKEEQVEFHLAGGFSDESGIGRQEFESLLEKAGVVYHGYTEDLRTLYHQCDMFVLPSTYGEGLPRVLLEAAACGCLLLAYDNSGSNRAIRHDINGWTSAEATVAAMQDFVDIFLKLSYEERLKMSLASRQHVENGFSETEVINAYLDLLPV